MSILQQIVSGGQTGADRAALDTAIKFTIPHGGWITKGRRTESGPLPDRYQLREMPTSDYPSRTRQNIIDSQGTAIISRGALTGGSKLTYSFARVAGKPVCHIDLLDQDIFEAALILLSFVLENNIGVLNVAGPRASHDPSIYFDVKSVIESMLYLEFLDADGDSGLAGICPGHVVQGNPETLDQAVELIAQDLSLKSKTLIARLEEDRIPALYFTMMDYLKQRTGLDRRDSPLLSALNHGQDPAYTPEDGAMALVKELKAHLNQHHGLRILS